MNNERQKISYFSPLPQTLFPRRPTTKGDSDLTDDYFNFQHGFNVWYRETIGRKRDTYGILQAARGENPLKHGIEGFSFAHYLDIADRATNGLRVNLLFDNRYQSPENKSKFGLLVNYGYNNPKFADHGFPHIRRVERFIETMLLNIGKLRHSKSVKQFVDPLLLFANFHDFSQVYNLQNKIPNERKAHELEGAIMLLALHNRYAIERKITNYDAWQKCAQAATMVMIHDMPHKFMKILNSTVTANELVKSIEKREEKIKKLAEVFDKESETVCDVTTISPHDLLQVLAFIKGDINSPTFGLPEEFFEEYKNEILTGKKSLVKNNRPLIFSDYDSEGGGIPEDYKEAFKLATEVAQMADLIDMRIPGEESIFRTLKAKQFSQRQFFPKEDFSYDQIKDFIINGSGEISSDSPYFSDVVRILWEAVNIEKLISGLPEGDPLFNSRFLEKIIKDASIMSVLSLQEIGNRLLVRDFSVVNEAYQRRSLALVRKAEERSGLKLAGLTKKEKIHVLSNNQKIDLGERLLEGIRNLETENKEIGSTLEKKIQTAYSEKQISNFNDLINQVLEELFTRYQVTSYEEKRYRKLVFAHRLPPSLPYKSYESLGIFPPRTLVEPIGPLEDMTVKKMKYALKELGDDSLI